MKGYRLNIEDATIDNQNFRRVLYTGKQTQLVLMSLAPQEEIGLETHTENDQFFRFEAGSGKCIIDDTEYIVSDGIAVVVPAGAQHNIINTSSTERLQFYTLYSPPHHQDGLQHQTKVEAEENEADFDGHTTE